jgi:hypothetical protein
VGMSRQLSRYFDDEEHHAYYEVLSCFDLKEELNELIGHPKDRVKNRPNSRTNSLQQGENDAD